MNKQALRSLFGVPFLALSLVYVYGVYVFFGSLFAMAQ